MDKKDIKEEIKIVLKVCIGIFFMVGLPFVILTSIGDTELMKENIISFFMAIITLIIIASVVIGLSFIFVKYKRNKDTVQSKKYVRDLPEYFPPAIASFLLDLSIETTTDYTATIAYLISNKYITLDEDGVNILNSNLEKLSNHEKYVLECLKKEKDFNHDEFKKIILEDAQKMNLIKKGRRKINFLRNFGISILLSFIFYIISQHIFRTGVLNQIFSVIYLICCYSIFAVIVYSIHLANKYINESFHRTLLGEEEALRWSGLKKYLNEYTLVSDKQLDHITLLENYIPYAIALNEATAIEKFIEDNEIYRRIIYNRNIE